MKLYLSTAAVGALLLSATSASAVTLNIEDDAAALAAATLASDSGISIVAGSEGLIGAEDQQGTYSNFDLVPGNDADPILSLDDGVVLGTGDMGWSTTTNTTNSYSQSSGTGSYDPLVALAADNDLSQTHNDTNVLSFDFILDDPTQNSVMLDFLFATDEFPTQSVTDIMAVFVNGVNYAFFPNGDLVSNQSGDPNSFFNDNSVLSNNYGIEWNGLTDVFGLTALANGDGAVNTIEFAIADTSDTIFDSALFFSGLTGGVTDGDGGIDPDPMSPVPLPAAGWMLLAALGGLVGWKRRKTV